MRDITTTDLSSRYVKPDEASRLGVVSGWYTTKMSGTFVTGPHDTQADAQKRILQLNPSQAPEKKS